MVDGEEKSSKKASWDVMKFVQKTPCTRDSLMYGIVGGLTFAALYFLKTSHLRRSCDVAVGSFALISLSSWEVCRYYRQKEQEKVKQTIDLLNQRENQKNDEPKQA